MHTIRYCLLYGKADNTFSTLHFVLPLLEILDQQILPAEFAVVPKMVYPLPVQKMSRIKRVICNVAGKENSEDRCGGTRQTCVVVRRTSGVDVLLIGGPLLLSYH